MLERDILDKFLGICYFQFKIQMNLEVNIFGNKVTLCKSHYTKM
jgi:hypothetical protein